MTSSKTAPDTRVACTFDDCSFYFKSVEQMKKHKSRSPEHEYCVKCDEDFQSEESHLIHKIKSTKHVTCPMCGEDFKSEGGRDMHIRQLHRADQDITCVGCAAKFVRAAALMAHIENNQCETISSDAYIQERAKKAVLKEAVAKVLNSDNPLPAPPKLGSEVSSVDGGVPVDPLSLLDDDDGHTERGRSSRGPHSTSRSAISNMASRKHWPTLGSERSTAKDEAEEDVGDDLMAFSTLSVDEENVRPGPSTYGQSASTSHRGGWETGTTTESGIPTNFGLDRDDGAMPSPRPNNKWDPNRFFDSFLGVYTCICENKYTTLADFEAHMGSGIHSQGRIRCPACQKIFKTIAAVVAHCESATVKCRINQSSNFDSIIQDISGGVVEASGHHIDGTVRYAAGQIMDIARVPAGQRKTKW
ncbi:hypothetical protein FQN54_007981 [Arachnomyces sp. PD_36]|nr:hypothetical protein FQN54_007981 [Arachnomyces sp. PD_36]